MPEPLLTILKLCCLALLYLFFLRVLRAVWAEVNAPPLAAAAAPATAAPPGRRPKGRGKGPATHLVVVEPRDQRGRTFELGQEVTVGRAGGCQITLDDSYASQLHARVFERDGILYVEDLGSTNGTFVDGRKVTSPVALQRGDHVKVGNTVLEVAG